MPSIHNRSVFHIPGRARDGPLPRWLLLPFQYEEQTFQRALDAMHAGPAFHQDIGDVLATALQHYHFDFVRKIVAEIHSTMPPIVASFAFKRLEAHTPIVCTVEQYQLSDTPPFEALSYVWGEPDNPIVAKVNDSYLQITKNLANALQRLRDPNMPRRLWVDAICINQADLDEKNQQIPLMRDIYLSATRTLMYIGEASESLGPYFQAKQSMTMRYDFLDHPGLTDFVELCRRPYFFRTWTIQEFVLGNDATIVCGPYRYPLYLFIPEVLKAISASSGRLKRAPHFVPLYNSHVGMPLGIRPRGSSPIEIIQISKDSTATDPRDKIYGLQGLLEEQAIPVDYTWTVQRVYIEFTKAAVQKSNTLTALTLKGWQKSMSALPSWTPDYSLPSTTNHLPSSDLSWPRHLHCDGQVRGLRFDGDFMIVKGKRIGSFARLGTQWPVDLRPAPSTNLHRSSIYDWGEMVCQLTHTRGLSALFTFGEILNGRNKTGSKLSADCLWWDREFGDNVLRQRFPLVFQRAELIMAICDPPVPKPGTKLFWLYDPPTIPEICSGRSLFVTGKGQLGLAPPGTVQSDEIVFLPGARHAMVIRRSREGKCAFVGECILEGLNDAVIHAFDSEIPMEEFVFE
ncbi:hypothetical protein BST61_g1318 [Cercospora zeina]